MKSLRVCFSAAFILALCSCQRPPSYAEFVCRDQKFYASVAAACDQFLLEQGGGETPSVWIPADLTESFLPLSIRNLHPDRIETSIRRINETNSIFRIAVMIGVRHGKLAKAGFAVVWENTDQDPLVWNLSAQTTSTSQKNLFSLRKTAANARGH